MFCLFLFVILSLVFLKVVGCDLLSFLSPEISSVLRFKILISRGEILRDLTKFAVALVMLT